jgi:hypothetical protein
MTGCHWSVEQSVWHTLNGHSRYWTHGHFYTVTWLETKGNLFQQTEFQGRIYDSLEAVSLCASFPDLKFRKWVKESQNISLLNDKDSFVRKRHLQVNYIDMWMHTHNMPPRWLCCGKQPWWSQDIENQSKRGTAAKARIVSLEKTQERPGRVSSKLWEAVMEKRWSL